MLNLLVLDGRVPCVEPWRLWRSQTSVNTNSQRLGSRHSHQWIVRASVATSNSTALPFLSSNWPPHSCLGPAVWTWASLQTSLMSMWRTTDWCATTSPSKWSRRARSTSTISRSTSRSAASHSRAGYTPVRRNATAFTHAQRSLKEKIFTCLYWLSRQKKKTPHTHFSRQKS